MGKMFIDHGDFIELKIIGYKRNGSVLFDKEDLPIVKQYEWHINSNGYAVNRNTWRKNNHNTIRLHRLIMNYDGEHDIDHINGNKLDNRKANLRICTRAENLWNTIRQRHKMHNISHTRGLYRVEVMRNGVRYRSPFFHTLKAAIEHRIVVMKNLPYYLSLAKGEA